MKSCSYIDDYIDGVLSGEIAAGKRLVKACRYIRRQLKKPGVYVDIDKTEKAIELIEKYFGYELFDWEKFVLGLVHMYHRPTDSVVFAAYLLMMGRGNGKNGFVSGVAWYLTTHYHGVHGYNVDIIANSEDQAKTSFEDVYQMLEDNWSKMQKFFRKTKLEITSIKTRSYIKFNSSNARTKDGKRSACLIFDEIHEYENSDTLKVFRSGFGKRKHSRLFFITTNGYVTDGVLDDQLRIADDILNGIIKDSKMCPLIWELDSDEEADDPANWHKANPSLKYMPNLLAEIEQNALEKAYDASVALDFYTKRMNRRRSDRDISVTDYEFIKGTNKPLPDLTGWSCTCGIDYAELNDWAAVNLHFKKGDERFDINHAWLCLKSPELHRVRAPWREWAEAGHITPVDDVSIHPDLLADWIYRQARRYNIKMLALDNYRYALVAESLHRIGFDAKDKKNVRLIRPSDIMQLDPVIQECFNRYLFTWGDNPCLRWAVNNTKRVRSSRKIGVDTGNFIYAKIEGKARKTDPFMALVASMVVESALIDVEVKPPPVGAFVF